jgi:hypothetical protein
LHGVHRLGEIGMRGDPVVDGEASQILVDRSLKSPLRHNV